MNMLQLLTVPDAQSCAGCPASTATVSWLRAASTAKTTAELDGGSAHRSISPVTVALRQPPAYTPGAYRLAATRVTPSRDSDRLLKGGSTRCARAPAVGDGSEYVPGASASAVAPAAADAVSHAEKAATSSEPPLGGVKQEMPGQGTELASERNSATTHAARAARDTIAINNARSCSAERALARDDSTCVPAGAYTARLRGAAAGSAAAAPSSPAAHRNARQAFKHHLGSLPAGPRIT